MAERGNVKPPVEAPTRATTLDVARLAATIASGLVVQVDRALLGTGVQDMVLSQRLEQFAAVSVELAMAILEEAEAEMEPPVARPDAGA